MLSEENKEDIKNLVLEAENNPPPKVELLTGRALAQAFIQTRLNNARSLEGVKAKALEALVNKIDQNTRPELLMKIIETLDNSTSKDMEILAAMSQEKNSNSLLTIEAEKNNQPIAVANDNSMKMLHNVLHALKVMKNESTEPGASS